MKDVIKLMLKGGVIGIANVIPGVSGGTMAVVLGIYQKLIEAIGNFLTQEEKRKEYAIFLGKVFAGAGAAIVVFSWLMDYLLTHYEQHTYLFFIGLILGSVPSIYKTHSNMKLSLPAFLTFCVGISLILLIFLFAPVHHAPIKTEMGVSIDARQAIMLVISGIFSGGSMIMPGISGSFILVLLGQYHIVIRAVKNINVIPLFFLGIGVAFGIWSFAKIIDILLKRFPKETFYFILGLVVASVVPIFPGIPTGFGGVLTAIVVFSIAVFLSYKLGDR